ncbi:MAG: RNA polymerase sigma factor [Janthinobacterium lividum]
MPSPDATLWADFRAGDEQAFERIFLAYYDALYSYGLRLTNDEELTKDCLQNLFQRLWQRRSMLGAVEVIRPYLFKALRHQIADDTKVQQRHSLLPSDYPVEFEVQYSPEDFLIAQQLTAEQQVQLLAALAQLTSRQREAIHLKFFDGFAYERIADIMAVTPQSVRNLVHQGLKQLKQSLTLALWLLVGMGWCQGTQIVILNF